MPQKVKPAWVCQHCSRPFTTKYSLMRHFKRFPEHAPPNLHPDDPKPITITLDDGARTVQAAGHGEHELAMSSYSSVPIDTAAETPHQYFTRKRDAAMVTGEAVPVSAMTSSAPLSTTTFPVVVEPTPSTETPSFGSPTPANTKGQFPFLPPFLEAEQILSIATPQQVGTPQPYAAPSSSVSSTPAVLPPNSSAAGPLQSPLWPGETLLSPLAPACNYGPQVFSDEEHLVSSSSYNSNPRSPLELEALENSLLVGDEEATSPMNFLEKTCALTTDPILMATSLDFMASPPYKHQQQHSRPMDVPTIDMEFGFAPMV